MIFLCLLSIFFFPFNSADCGFPSIEPDVFLGLGKLGIVGGKDAKAYSWPWMVALYKKSILGVELQFCAGSLISNEWVMTAAHCFYHSDSLVSKYNVKLGVYDKRKNDEDGESIMGIKEIHVHPEYNARKRSYDIALLKLSTKINYTPHISPICLPKQNDSLPLPNTNLVVIGWGNTIEGGSDSNILKQVVVPLLDNETCSLDYPDEIVHEVMFCAGLKIGGKDSCQGDSGGPIVHYDKEHRKWIQLGIVSWGKGCAEAGQPGVYSKVASYIDWIDEIIQT